MNMLTSADAINAEIEYRRERVRVTSRVIRRRRSARRQRALVAEQVRARRAANAAAEWDERRPAATLPTQRTSERSTTTNQPV